nr:hypothetical protein [Candidatus Sigynarchaeota archaeon]
MHEPSGTPISIESIQFESLQTSDSGEKILLPEMTPDQVDAVDPLIPPTSGIRLKILDNKDGRYICPASKYALFLRLFKAISMLMTEKLRRPARILLTSDERPTSDRLAKHAMQIFSFDGHELLIQTESKKTISLDAYTHSGMSTPYSSACIAVVPNIDAVIVVTASHNSAIWNGIKFYFKQSIPIAGDLMKEISKKAIALKEIPLKKEGQVVLKGEDHESRINKYVKDVLKEIIPIQGIKGSPVVLWPYMGAAKEIHELLTHYGVNVIKINKTMEPPDPTVNLPFEEVKGYLEKNNSKLAILLDADRDRIVFIIKIGNNYVQLNPNELYTSMHNLLFDKFGKKIINVRTVPSDPRSDNKAICTIETGVGYKHLGVVQYLACGIDVDKSQFESSLIYGKTKGARIKIDSSSKLFDFLGSNVPKTKDVVLMVLWEESGGHTVNLVKPKFKDGKIERLEPCFPLIGDKFPAPAIVLLAELIGRGNNLLDAIDASITGIRVEIEADDKRKQAIMKALEERVNQEIKVGDMQYKVVDYRDNQGLLDIIGLAGERSTIYARPSGTGNSVRIYLFGDKTSGKAELERVAEYLKKI